MGICTYCGKSAGLFHKVHPKCIEKYELGKEQIRSLTSTLLSTSLPIKHLGDEIKEIAETSYIREPELLKLKIRGWEKAIESALDEGVLSEAQDKRLADAKDEFGFSDNELREDDDGAYTRIVKSSIIRDLLNGIIPSRMRFGISLPINFQKGEKIVWVFRGCEYFENQTMRTYVGTSQGFSVKVAKGLYYRKGSFESHPVEQTNFVRVDEGLLAITDKNIYFDGSNKSFRLPFKKIVSFESFSDGIGIVRDLNNAKLQVFRTDDGWFTYNLIANLAHLAS